MRPKRAVFGLVAIASFILAIIATYNYCVPSARSVGPDWFRAFSLFGGTAAMLVGLVTSVAFAQAGQAGRVGPPGLQLGERTLRLGAILLVVGVLWPVLVLLHLIPSPPLVVLLAALKLPPVLIAFGAVLLRNSLVALGREADDPLKTLSLGRATYRSGLVLLLLGFGLPMAIGLIDGEMGMLGTIIAMDCIPAGVVLLILGAFIEGMNLVKPRSLDVSANE